MRQVSGGGAGPVARQTDGMGHHSHSLQGHHRAGVKAAGPSGGDERNRDVTEKWCGLLARATWDMATLGSQVQVRPREVVKLTD